MPFQSSNPALARALAERNYDQATDVQTATLEPAAAGRDLLVSAQTGSGKTVAYGLAIAEDLFAGAPALGAAGEPLALIITPTRELALQVQRELEWLYQYAGARVISCVGGMEPRRERRDLAAGAHIVVGTPGRLRDHIERGALIVSRLKAVVLDEADEMLDLGFREDLEFILQTTPPERRTLLFSATIPKGIATLAKRFQKNALRIEVAGKERGHADIEYRAMRVAPNEIEHAVVNVLRVIDPPGAIVFCNTREAVRHLHAFLVERGFSAALLSGELSQNERNHALQALRDGRARVCVATDVAARGIDLPGLALVIHADLPHDAEILQHRSGRTGRAGRKGISIILVPAARKRRAERLLMEAGLRPTWSGPPTAEEIRRLDHERLLRDPLLDQPIGDEDAEIARALLDERSPEAIAAALARLLRARLPAAEEVQDPGEGARSRPLREGGPQRPQRESEGGVWFKLDIGAQKKADPKWLLPMLCRRGDVTKQDIGAIRIFDRETWFEVAEPAAKQFFANVQRQGGGHGKDQDAIRIDLADGAPQPGAYGGPSRGAPPSRRTNRTKA
ncbi:DEAD/DEAH box helicase [Methylocella silvestris]|uniref:DEAD/DEAH box helicase n=1 Tax=Methylocella silvestris TaxID=199596 RepID=A0A2J7TKP5_METSI|nr:DEAD/DEAH box helicase [Methylocella silvestris]PNG27352.1 DEAD/DEAH box helicase [Methylocella silvestris]